MIELMQTFFIAFLISGYQIYRCLKYLKNSIRLSHSYNDKTEQGSMKLWEYLFLFIPIRYRDYYATPGLQGGNFYLTPLVVFFALFGNIFGWFVVFICIFLSTGGRLFKWLSPFMLRLPFYWGYFASLIIVMLSVEGLTSMDFNDTQLVLLCIMVGMLLLHNSFNLPLYPEGMYPKRPSEWFETPLLKWLEKNAKGCRVNNMQYPYYHGQINHIRSMGYCGGNHTKYIHDIRNLPNTGCGGYNWFDYKEDGVDLDIYEVGFHIGERPSSDEKWIQHNEFKNLWINKNVVANTLLV